MRACAGGFQVVIPVPRNGRAGLARQPYKVARVPGLMAARREIPMGQVDEARAGAIPGFAYWPLEGDGGLRQGQDSMDLGDGAGIVESPEGSGRNIRGEGPQRARLRR